MPTAISVLQNIKSAQEAAVSAIDVKVAEIAADKKAFAEAKIKALDDRLKSSYLGQSMREHLEGIKARITKDMVKYADEQISLMGTNKTKLQSQVLTISSRIAAEEAKDVG